MKPNRKSFDRSVRLGTQMSRHEIHLPRDSRHGTGYLVRTIHQVIEMFVPSCSYTITRYVGIILAITYPGRSLFHELRSRAVRSVVCSPGWSRGETSGALPRRATTWRFPPRPVMLLTTGKCSCLVPSLLDKENAPPPLYHGKLQVFLKVSTFILTESSVNGTGIPLQPNRNCSISLFICPGTWEHSLCSGHGPLRVPCCSTVM